MPGNRAIYDRAVEQFHEAARQQDWGRALKEALRAMNELPKEMEARIALATALFHNDKLPQALQLFEELRAADPQNPVFIEHVARIKRRQGETEKTVELLLQLAEIQQNQKLPLKAIEHLREALEVEPKHFDARIGLATLLVELGDKKGAIVELLALARLFIESDDLTRAQEAVDEVLGLDPGHKEALQLQAQIQLVAPAPLEEQSELPRSDTGSLRSGTGSLRAPSAVESALVQAHELQQRGDTRGAILQYERVLEISPNRPDVCYSLGLLYAELDDIDRAVAMLERAAADHEYMLSAHYTLGNIYQALERHEEAAEQYEQTIRLVELENIGKDEAADLIQMYEAAGTTYEQLGDLARASSLYSTLAGFLQTKRWGRDQAEVFNKKAKDLTERSMFSKLRMIGTGMLNTPPPEPEPEPAIQSWGKIPSITDFLNPKRVDQEPGEEVAVAVQVEPDPLAGLEALPETGPTEYEAEFAPLTELDTTGCSELVERYVQASAKFVEQSLYYAAMDACHEVIRNDLEYLPIHLRLGQIYERMGRREDAASKYQLLVETFEARGENQRAIDVYYRLLDLSPDSTNMRSKLSDLLREAGRNDEAALMLASVAQTHYRMGQSNKALEEFRRLIQWAPENRDLRVQYGQLLLKLERWEAALSEFRKVVELDPESPVGLALLNIALALSGEYPSAIWDSLASVIAKLRARPAALGQVVGEYQSGLLTADRPLLHYSMGVLQQALGQHPSALLSLEQALALLSLEQDPLLPELLVRQTLAQAYVADGQPDRAIEELRRCEAILVTGIGEIPKGSHPFSTAFSAGELQRHLAEAYADAGDLQGATSALQEVKRLIPYDRIAYTKLAEVYFRQGRLQEALAQLDELASYYEGQQQLDKALEILENGVKLAPNNIAVRRRLGDMYIRRGYLDQGIDMMSELADLQRAQGQIKDAVQSLGKAAEVHWMLGRHDRCYALYERILQFAPNDIEARTQLSNFYILSGRSRDAFNEQKKIAQICVQQRNYEEAISAFHGAISLVQDDTETYEQFGEVLMRVKEYDQALRIYRRLLKLVQGDERDRVEAMIGAAQRMLDQQSNKS